MGLLSRLSVEQKVPLIQNAPVRTHYYVTVKSPFYIAAFSIEDRVTIMIKRACRQSAANELLITNYQLLISIPFLQLIPQRLPVYPEDG